MHMPGTILSTEIWKWVWHFCFLKTHEVLWGNREVNSCDVIRCNRNIHKLVCNTGKAVPKSAWAVEKMMDKLTLHGSSGSKRKKRFPGGGSNIWKASKVKKSPDIFRKLSSHYSIWWWGLKALSGLWWANSLYLLMKIVNTEAIDRLLGGRSMVRVVLYTNLSSSKWKTRRGGGKIRGWVRPVRKMWHCWEIHWTWKM